LLWVFVILGLAALASSLHAVLAPDDRTGRLRPAVSLVLVICAWVAQHTTLLGWAALGAAIAMELFRRLSANGRVKPIVVDHTNDPSSARNELSARLAPPSTPPLESAAIRKPWTPPTELVSVVLLKEARQVSGQVVVASLRRAGLRDSALVRDDSESQTCELSVGSRRILLHCIPRPVVSDIVEYALAQSWDWPDAAPSVRGHSAQVACRTQIDGGSREEMVRLHSTVAAALCEFAPVIGVLWPEAGRLIAAAQLMSCAASTTPASLMAATCVSFRSFTDGEGASAKFVCDTAGLSAMGLIDLQVICDTEPGEEISATLYRLAEQMFTTGRKIEPGTKVPGPDGREWSAESCQAKFPPMRPVLELRPPPQESSTSPAETPA
jgi:hypothetical protein